MSKAGTKEEKNCKYVNSYNSQTVPINTLIEYVPTIIVITNPRNGNFLISPEAESAYTPAMVKAMAMQTVTTYNIHSCPKQRCLISSEIP
mgnify:FL=1